MSWDINHVVIVGRLTRDPDLTYTQSGSAVCRFSVAVNRSSGPAAEGQEETTSFFNVVAWNKTAELCKEYLSKGKQVGIDGRLQQRRWSGNDGAKRSSVEIVANNVQFFGPPTARGGERQYQTAERSRGSGRQAPPGARAGEHPPGEYPEGEQPGGNYPEDFGQPGNLEGAGGAQSGGQKAGTVKGGGEQEHDPFLSELDDDEIPF
jgi:single-strand DNA-binding protein